MNVGMRHNASTSKDYDNFGSILCLYIATWLPEYTGNNVWLLLISWFVFPDWIRTAVIRKFYWVMLRQALWNSTSVFLTSNSVVNILDDYSLKTVLIICSTLWYLSQDHLCLVSFVRIVQIPATFWRIIFGKRIWLLFTK